jgi:thioredoxin reductase
MKALNKTLPVAVIGAGPVGMAAAAHLIRQGFTPLVLEAGASVASNLETYRHVHMFSPWRYNIDRAAGALLADAGWQAPELDDLPTAGEIIDQYLQPLAALPPLADAIQLQHVVTSMSRDGYDKVKTAGRDSAPFVIRADTPQGPAQFHAQAVIDATGTWSQPNPLGANGLPALGERELATHIQYGMPDILGADQARYAGKRVLVVGAGHSAAGSLIALADLAARFPATSIVWAVRGGNLDRTFGGGSADQLPARGELGMRLKAMQDAGRLELHLNFRVRALHLAGQQIVLTGEAVGAETPVIGQVDAIIGATGARPNLAIARELRVRLDPWLESTDALAPLIDPNMHSCGTVRPHGHRELAHPEVGYYAVGAKSYGRAPNFLMATGYEQVRSIVAALAGDMAAANDVQLELPETGVCNTRPRSTSASAGGSCCPPLPAAAPAALDNTAGAAGCCGGAAPAGSDACCVLDADEKAKGNAGCGCATKEPLAQAAPAPACCN